MAIAATTDPTPSIADTSGAPLDWRRVYVFPTRQGFGLAGLLVVILLGAINYDNALAFLLCFLLGGLFLVAMLHTYHNLAGLRLAGVRVEPVFAGQSAVFNLQFDSLPQRPRFALALARQPPARAWWRRGPRSTATEVALLTPSVAVPLAVPTTRRGVLALGRVSVESTFPLGFVRAWAYFRPGTEVLVYPTPIDLRPLPLTAAATGEQRVGSACGVEDFAGLRPYRAGDPLRAVAWRALARHDEMLVKQFRGGGAVAVVLRWSDLPPNLDPEARLSQLTQWVLEAERAGLRYALELPGERQPAGSGYGHRLQCLRALATHRA